jgi:carbon storage regulator
MLILTRRPSEQIVIGDQVRITVVAVRGEKVRLGIDAPREVPVHRNEVYEAIRHAAKRPGGTQDAPPPPARVGLDADIGC